jgi:basic amino acid/polyamine antiporter, APA family
LTGFDSVTTLAGEVKKPARDLPVGIVATLFVVTILYVLFTLVLTGMQPYDQINPNTPAVSVRFFLSFFDHQNPHFHTN